MIGDRWGVTEPETSAAYPCDSYVLRPTLQAWRGVSIDAPVGVVWNWLIQVRLAPYSYDWIDNGGRRSPSRLMGVDDPKVGDPLSACAGRPVGRVIAVDRHRHLTAEILGAMMTYQLVAIDEEQTRLILKIVGDPPRWLAPLGSLGDLLMARRQLLNFKKYAEASAAERNR